MFSIDLLFAIRRDVYIFKETGWFCRFPKHQKLDKRAMAGEKRQTCWPKHWNRVRKPAHCNSVKQKYKQKYKQCKEMSDGYVAYLLTQETSLRPLNKTVPVEMEKRKSGKKRWLRFRWSYVWFWFDRTLFSRLYWWRTSIRMWPAYRVCRVTSWNFERTQLNGSCIYTKKNSSNWCPSSLKTRE